MAAVSICSYLGAKTIKSLTFSIVSPSICHEGMGPHAMILVFWMLRFKPAFSLSSFTFIKRLFNSSLLSAIRVLSSAYLRLLKSPLTMSKRHGKQVGFGQIMWMQSKRNKTAEMVRWGRWEVQKIVSVTPVLHFYLYPYLLSYTFAVLSNRAGTQSLTPALFTLTCFDQRD